MNEACGFETICQHLGEETSYANAVNPPIFQTSLFTFDDMDAFLQKESGAKRHMYTRVGNPTTDIAEKKIAALERTERCRLFGSGMAAISAAIMSATAAGKHVVATEASYGPTKEFLREYLPRFGVVTTFVDGRNTDAVAGAIRPHTTAIYMESPGTFLFHIQDIAAICEIAHVRGITTIIDNSYASPYFQQPATLGADLVLHSATKYLAGHSDVVAGAVCGSEQRMAKLIQQEGLLLGAVMDPFAAWLMIRSLRTLPIRMERHRANADKVASFLEKHPKISCVFYPGSKSHEGYDLARKQMSGASGLLSFRPAFCDDKSAVKKFCEGLALFQMGVSWGGHDSLVVPLNSEETGHRWLVRLSIGLETAEDLIADLNAALTRV